METSLLNRIQCYNLEFFLNAKICCPLTEDTTYKLLHQQVSRESVVMST